MKNHYITYYTENGFYGPYEVSEWNYESGLYLADHVFYSYNTTPIAFFFYTEEDDKVLAKSGFYYLGGTAEKFVMTHSAEKPLMLLREGDVILDYIPPGKR